VYFGVLIRYGYINKYNLLLKHTIMKRYNLSQIMKDAHRFYRSNSRMGRTFGECLKLAWTWAKDAIKFKEEREAKIKAMIAHQKPQGLIV
jgi:hypothetical protein